MYEYKVREIIRVIDGDTVDLIIDLGFNVLFNQRIRLAGIDTPESRTSDEREKVYGLDAKHWLEGKLKGSSSFVIRTQKLDSEEKYGRILGHLFCQDEQTSINEQMLLRGLAWPYDGGTKVKDFSALDKARNVFST